MDLLDQLQAAVTSASERVGPSVIGLGRGWGRGSGVVIAPDRVLTSAHVLRGDEVTAACSWSRRSIARRPFRKGVHRRPTRSPSKAGPAAGGLPPRPTVSRVEEQ